MQETDRGTSATGKWLLKTRAVIRRRNFNLAMVHISLLLRASLSWCWRAMGLAHDLHVKRCPMVAFG